MNCVCHKCTASLQPDRTVVLWDGNVYCLSCLDAKDPSLATYASSHNMLEETMPGCLGRQVGLFVRMFAVIWCLSGR